jgi:hypothetical protein
MYDLPSEDSEEPGVPDQFHLWQPRLLDETFRPPTYPPDQVFTASEKWASTRIWYKSPGDESAIAFLNGMSKGFRCFGFHKDPLPRF